MNIGLALAAAKAAASPARIYAIGAILALLGAAVAYHLVQVHSLEADVASAQAGTEKAVSMLNQRIAAEARAVTEAVQKARAEERAALTNLQKDHDELKKARAADADALDAARQRLYQLAKARPAPGPGGADLPGAAAAAGRVEGATTRLSEADRVLTDRLLQVGAAANEAARQRDFAVKQYEANCRKSDAPAPQ